jgi:hypothetical protein
MRIAVRPDQRYHMDMFAAHLLHHIPSIEKLVTTFSVFAITPCDIRPSASATTNPVRFIISLPQKSARRLPASRLRVPKNRNKEQRAGGQHDGRPGGKLAAQERLNPSQAQKSR